METNNPPKNVLPSFINYKPQCSESFPSKFYTLIINLFLVATNLLNKVKNTNKELCIICLSKIKDPVRPEHCHHIFCKECFRLYSQSFSICPICKKPFNKIIDIFSMEKKSKTDINPFFNDLTGDRLYRLSLKKIPDDICVVCKKNVDKDFLITCDKCGMNLVHYYCDPSPQIGVGFYICPICRIRCYKMLKKK